MESLQYKKNTICTVLEQIDQYYIKAGRNKVNMIRFEVGYEPNLYNFKIVSAFDRLLRTSLTLCNLEDEISDELLEKIKLTINKLQ